MTEAGHNSTFSEEDRRVLVAHFHKKDLKLFQEAKEIAEARKANRQNAKAVGIPAAQLEHYLKSFLAEDQQKPVDKHRLETQNLIWLGLIPDNKGADLLSYDRVDAEEMVRRKGFGAGLIGSDRVSGYDAGSSDDKIWMESYDAGREEYDTKLPDLMARIEQQASKEAAATGEDPFPDDDDNS